MIFGKTGRSVREIVEESGWQAFREAEKRHLGAFPSRRGRHRGRGRRRHDPENVAMLRRGPVRLAPGRREDPGPSHEQGSKRRGATPLAHRAGSLAEVEEVLAKRLPVYRAVADVIIDTAGKRPDEIAAEIAGSWERDRWPGQQRKAGGGRMSGNTFGVLFRVTTFGESHGKASGRHRRVPAEPRSRRGRHPGGSRPPPARGHAASTSRKRKTAWRSSRGLRGKTTARRLPCSSSTAMRQRRIRRPPDVFRPGTAIIRISRSTASGPPRRRPRLGARDGGPRGGRRRRPQAPRPEGMDVVGYTVELGGIAIERFSRTTSMSTGCAARSRAATRMEQNWRRQGTRATVSAALWRSVSRLPCGLGEPVFDKIDADLAGPS